MSEEVMLLSVKDEKIKNREHEMLPLTHAYFSSYVEKDKRIISKQEFKRLLRQTLHKRGPKIDKIVNAYLMLGTIIEDGDNYIISEVKDNFVRLTIPTAQFCIENLSEFSMKIYCYLLNKQQIHDTYHHKENYFFSVVELLRVTGYSEGSKNKLKVIQSLNILENFGLIKYNHDSVGRPGVHGTYMELYGAYQYSKTQVDAANDFIKTTEVISDPYVAQQVCIPGVDIETIKLAGDAKLWLEQGMYTLDCLPGKYLEAYNNVYKED